MDGVDRNVKRLTRLALTTIGLPMVIYVLIVGFQPQPAEAQSDAGAEVYSAYCASCHQAGGQGLAGAFPPLAGNPSAADVDYVTAVIQEGVTGPLVVLGETFDGAMPAISGLEKSELESVVAYVASLAGGQGTTSTPPPSVEPPADGDVDRGHDLFIGSNRFDSGGTACVACHTAGSVGNLGGRSLGPDLTNTFTKLGGEPGLTAWLSNPPAPTMRPVFSDRPLTEAEIADVVAFLADAPDQDPAADAIDGLLIAGIGGAVALIGAMAIAWRGMRQTYMERIRSRR
jgi:ubiquinol-cytochrome c reductase cytochrome c subunit